MDDRRSPLRSVGWGVALGGATGAVLLLVVGVTLGFAADWVVDTDAAVSVSEIRDDPALKTLGSCLAGVALIGLAACARMLRVVRPGRTSVGTVTLVLLGALVGLVVVPGAIHQTALVLRGLFPS